MNRIPELRKERGISMKQAAEQLGMPYTTYVNYEKGVRQPNSETLIDLANFYNTSIDYMLGKSNDRLNEHLQVNRDTVLIPPGFDPMPDMDTVPLVGRIACGTPITAEQNVEGMVCVPSAWRATFTLICRGSSMEPRIHDGDLVAIRSQKTVETGEIAAVRIGEEATLKHVYLHENFIELRPENPAFESIILTKEEMNTVVIEGKAVGLCRDI
nr:MAG TPA: Repressor protein CI [Caudoviricetes sp.]